MKFLSPIYSKKVLILQLIIVMLCSLSLYFFLHALQEEKRLRQERAAIALQQQKLQKLRRNVESYKGVLEKNSSLQTLRSDPTWEQVEFNWKSIEFPELLTRLDTLSRQQKLFVMESFEVGFESTKDSSEDAASALLEDTASLETKERRYHLEGYFLCPCL